jgi:hypothetical protein
MKRKRRHLTAEFKLRIAAELLKGEKSILQMHPANRPGERYCPYPG